MQSWKFMHIPSFRSEDIIAHGYLVCILCPFLNNVKPLSVSFAERHSPFQRQAWIEQRFFHRQAIRWMTGQLIWRCTLHKLQALFYVLFDERLRGQIQT